MWYVYIYILYIHIVWAGIVVSVATSCGLDGPGIESRWGARFSAPLQTGPGTHPVSYTMGTGSFPGLKRPGRGVDRPPPFSAEVKERVGLYLYSPSGPSCPVLGWTFMYILYAGTQPVQLNSYCLYTHLQLHSDPWRCLLCRTQFHIKKKLRLYYAIILYYDVII